jgi:hypothetical protein
MTSPARTSPTRATARHCSLIGATLARFAIGCAFVACSSTPRSKPPERAPDLAKPLAPRPGKHYPAPPAGFATAELVAISGGDLTTYATVDGKLQPTGTTSLAKIERGDPSLLAYFSLGAGGWADHDHLFVVTGTREVAMVTARAISEVPIPSEDRFKGPDNTVGAFGRDTGLIVADGDAWWVTCRAVDGFPCEHYIKARLWPSVRIETDSTPVAPRTDRWVDATPSGFTVTANGTKSVDCLEQGKTVALKADADATEEIESTHWVSASPPRLLVIYGHPGYTSSLVVDRWTLHAGCAEKPVATGSVVTVGPDGIWVARDGEGDTERQIVYRGGVELGTLPADATIYPRPAKP